MNYKSSWLDGVTLVVIWWLFWLIVTVNFDLEQMLFINAKTTFYVFNFILFTYIAGRSFKFDSNKFDLESVIFSSFIIVLCSLISVFIFSVNIYLAYKTYILLSSGHTYSEVRGMFFSITPSGNPWFSSTAAWAAYLITSALYFNLLVFVGIVSKIFYKKNFLLLMLISFILLDAFIKGGGRGGIYSLLLIYCLFFWAKFTFLNNKETTFGWRFFVILVLLSGVMILATVMRGQSNVITEFTRYHIFGIHLFSILVENDSLASVPLDYGRNFFGGADYYLHYVIRLFFNGEYLSPFMFNSATHDDYLVVSSYKSQVGGNQTVYGFNMANDFFTMLSTAYSDFKGLGVVLMGILVGITLKVIERKIYQHHSIVDIILYVYLIYSFLMGIFSTPFETPVFWVLIYVYFLIKRYNFTLQKACIS